MVTGVTGLRINPPSGTDNLRTRSLPAISGARHGISRATGQVTPEPSFG